MPKEEWGTKRLCPTTGKRFYDLGRVPIVSPYTGEIVQLETGSKPRPMVKEEKEKKPAKAADPLIDDEDTVLQEEETDVDLGDDVLDDDSDDDNVSLEDIADVGGDDDDS